MILFAVSLLQVSLSQYLIRMKLRPHFDTLNEVKRSRLVARRLFMKKKGITLCAYAIWSVVMEAY